MLEKLIMSLIFTIGSAFGWFLKKYVEQKFKKELEEDKSNIRIKENENILLKKKRLNAIEQINKNIKTFSQGESICGWLQNLNFKKLKNWETLEETNKIKLKNAFQETERWLSPIIQSIEKECREGLNEHKIEPYLSEDVWKLYSAYKRIILNAIFLIRWSSISGLDFLNFKKMEQNIEKHISPVIPEDKEFLKRDLLSRQFFVYDAVKEKLLKELKMIPKES